MSLIADALKTAQREKQQRAAGDRPVSVPLLVPLRSRPAAAGNRGRIALIAAAGVIVIGGTFYVVRARTRDASLVSVSFTVSDSVQPPASTARATRSVAPRALPSAPTRADTTRSKVAATTSSRAATRPIVSGQSAAPGLHEVPASAVQQAIPASRLPSPAGRLQISVDTPRDAEVARLLAVGVAAHRIGDFEGARRAYESVLTLAPTDVDALNNLALVLLAQGDPARAEVLLRRAISLAPRNGGAWSNLGTVLRMRGRSSDAIGAFQYALNIDPQNQTAKVGLAQQYLAIGSLDQARTLLQDAVAVDPASAEAQYTLGQVLELKADTVGAIRAYREFVRVAPQRLAASVERVRAHLDTLAARAP
jgi:Flp pilus assembly protein TadD